MAITTPSDFVRVDKTTIGEQIKGEELNIVRNQKVLALMEGNGRITFNHSGKRMEFNVRKARNSLVPYGDGSGLDFARINRWEDAALPWRGYVASESVGKLEKLKNQGQWARVNFIAEITEALMDDVRFGFGSELYKDGNASGNENRIHGWKSFLGYTGTAQYTLADDTYAGLDTDLGALGGAAISGTWPDGQFDPEYDAWTPLIVNYTNSSWSAATDNWANNCIEVLRAGIIHNANQRGLKQGMLELILMTATMYADFLNQIDDKERIVIERNAAQSTLIKLGFKDITNFDGVDLSYESEVPSGEAYGINTKTQELKSMQGQLFVPSDDYDLDFLSDRYAIDFFGNLQCNPRGFVFWKNIT
ncbi:MAG: phage major capsid protein [Gemmataceae bacterium]|nr:phage major capsid protein [Gemmataceae bacterium]